MSGPSSRASDRGTPKPGDVVDGTFLINNRLGGGAAGDTFKVALVRPWGGNPEGTPFCLKWYKDEIFKREPSVNVIARRVREASVGSSIRHPTLVRVSDTSEFWQDGVPQYLLMDLIEGETLEDFAKQGDVPTTRIRELLLDVATGLKALHDEKILHRDVKAANVMVNPEGRGVLLDLGVVRPESEATMTDTQAFLGTLRFAAPEWLFAESCDYKSDVYSLGTIAYHLLTGREIFSDIRLFSRIIEAVRSSEPPLPQDGGDLSREYLLNLTRRMLKKWPSERPGLNEVVELLADTEKCEVWIGLSDSGLFEQMPEYCRSDGEVQRSVVQATKDSIPAAVLREIFNRKDYDRLVRHEAVRAAITPPKLADLVSHYMAQPTENRVEWVTHAYHTIGSDPRTEWGAQIEGRWHFMRRLCEVEQSEAILQHLRPLRSQADAEMQDLISTAAQENPAD